MTEAFSKYAKIAAASEIDTIVERSLPGLPFEPYNMPIQGLPERGDSLKYELLIDDPQWNAIQQMQNITIEFNEALEDVAIELVVLKS
jgi:predicted component of type VI protein secretion system